MVAQMKLENGSNQIEKDRKLYETNENRCEQ